MDYYEKLRMLLKKRRLELNMMQTEVAEKADISNNFYSNIERGKTKPSVDTVFKICKALNLSLDEIIFDEENMSEELRAKGVIREFNNVFKGVDKKTVETMISFFNAIIVTLNKMKEE